MMERAWGHVDW